MIATLQELESRTLATLPRIDTEEALIEYKNTILGKN